MKEKEIDIVLWKVAANLAALILSQLKKACNVKSILSSIQFMSQDVNNLFATIQIPSDIYISVPNDEPSVSGTDTPNKKVVSVNEILFDALADNAPYLTNSLTTYFYNALVEAEEKKLYTKIVGNENANILDVEETVSSLQKEQMRQKYYP